MTSNDELERLQEMDKFEAWFLTFRKDCDLDPPFPDSFCILS